MAKPVYCLESGETEICPAWGCTDECPKHEECVERNLGKHPWKEVNPDYVFPPFETED